jgi:hypothetical protein
MKSSCPLRKEDGSVDSKRNTACPADHTWLITVAGMQQQQLFARLLVCLLACLLACLIACWGDGGALWVLQTSVIPHTQLLSGAVTVTTTSTSSSRDTSCQLAS